MKMKKARAAEHPAASVAVMTLRGVSGAKTGDRFSDVVKRFGKPAVHPLGTTHFAVWPKLGLEVSVWAPKGLIQWARVWFDVRQFRRRMAGKTRASLVASTWRTDAGIGADSTLQDLVKAYGKPSRVLDTVDTRRRPEQILSWGKKTQFWLSENRVFAVQFL